MCLIPKRTPSKLARFSWDTAVERSGYADPTEPRTAFRLSDVSNWVQLLQEQAGCKDFGLRQPHQQPVGPYAAS